VKKELNKSMFYIKVKVKKSKADTVHAMKTYKSGGIWFYSFVTSALDPHEWSALSPSHLHLEKDPQCTMDRRLDRIQSQAECSNEGQNILPLPRIK